MNAAWSTEQRRMLSALGYTLYGAVGGTATPAKATDGLAAAVLRAAGRDPGGIADAEGWLRTQGFPSLARLRTDPSAKRALWPRLRALRRDRR